MPNRRAAFATLLVVALGACAQSSGDNATRTAERAPVEDDSVLGDRTARGESGGSRDAASSSVVPLDRFRKREAMGHVRRLAGDIGVRVRATRGETLGARYVKARFLAMGYSVKVQRFAVDGGVSRNVVAWWAGARRYPMIVGGHIDTVEGSPGANDNASGVAVLLELARIFAGRRQARWVRFVAFGSEEYGSNGLHHVGSHVFVKRLRREGRARLAGMISVDMVADGRPLIVGTAGIGPEVVARTVFRKMRRAGIGVTYRTTCDCSDNGPFERAGLPAAFLWSGLEPNYHDPSDTVGNIQPDDLVRTGRGVRAFVRQLDANMIERFRRH